MSKLDTVEQQFNYFFKHVVFIYNTMFTNHEKPSTTDDIRKYNQLLFENKKYIDEDLHKLVDEAVDKYTTLPQADESTLDTLSEWIKAADDEIVNEIDISINEKI